MNWENLMVDTDQMESGKFYRIETNKDNVTVIVPVSVQDEINAKHESDIEILQNKTETITDNTARINNLEDRNLQQELLYALDQASIKATFVNQTEVVIQHNRKEVYFKKVMAFIGTIEGEEIHQDITDTVQINEIIVKDNQNNVIMKKVVIQSNSPITGYAIIV